jgi:hypothetical protein
MEINIRYSTIPKMLEVCKKHKEGKLYRIELEELLEHEDYKVEFDRYNTEGGPRGGFSKEEYVDFFMDFFTLDEDKIENERLKMRYEQLKYLFDNLEFYEENFKKVHSIDKNHVLKALEYTYFGLPSEVRFERLDIIFSIGLGNSGGWFYKHFSHYDLVHFLKEFDVNTIVNTMAHECHHIGYMKLSSGMDFDKLTPEEYLYFFLAGEGLAVKYCNNAEGVLTKSIYNSEVNIGLNSDTWKYLKGDFENTFKEFKAQIYKIRNNEIRTIDDLSAYINEYWMNLYTPEQDKSEVPKLSHSRNYFMGCDVWGLIHDVFGAEKVFEVLTDLKQFPIAFNSALEKIGRIDLCI